MKYLNKKSLKKREKNEIYPEFMTGYFLHFRGYDAFKLKDPAWFPPYLFKDNIINATATNWWKLIELRGKGLKIAN